MADNPFRTGAGTGPGDSLYLDGKNLTGGQSSGAGNGLAYDPTTRQGTPATNAFAEHIKAGIQAPLIKKLQDSDAALVRLVDHYQKTVQAHNRLKFRVDDLTAQVEMLCEALEVKRFKAAKSVESRVAEFAGQKSSDTLDSLEAQALRHRSDIKAMPASHLYVRQTILGGTVLHTTRQSDGGPGAGDMRKKADADGVKAAQYLEDNPDV